MTPIGRELTLAGGVPVPVGVASTRGRTEPRPGKVGVQHQEGSSSGLNLIARQVHHIMVEMRWKKSGKAGMEVQDHLLLDATEAGKASSGNNRSCSCPCAGEAGQDG